MADVDDFPSVWINGRGCACEEAFQIIPFNVAQSRLAARKARPNDETARPKEVRSTEGLGVDWRIDSHVVCE